MATPSIESTLKSTSGALKQIGFVEFTTDLVKNVYSVIVESSMDQLKNYADFVKSVSQPLGDYQKSLGLKLNGNILTLHDSGNETLLKNCENYAVNVLNLTPVMSSGATPIIEKYRLEGTDVSAALDKRNAIFADLSGFDDNGEDAGGDINSYLPSVADMDTNSELIEVDKKKGIDRLIALKLLSAAENEYNLLITILKIGMQKIVVDKGLIATKLTFHVDATESASFASSDLEVKSKSFGLTGGISGGTKKFGGRLSGAYNSSKLSVSVVNEKSSAVANMSADIVGEVRIEFRTESFPSTNINA